MPASGGTIYPLPIAAPIEHAVLVASDGKIEVLAAGMAMKIAIPANAQELDCKGKFIVAGFWNSHVLFEGRPHPCASERNGHWRSLESAY